MLNSRKKSRSTRRPKPGNIVVAFSPNGREFRRVRLQCAKACAEYNKTDEDTSSIERGSLFMNMLPTSAVHHAAPSQIQTPFFMDYGLRVSIHHTAVIEHGCKIVDTPVADIKIGQYCSIGPNVTIVSVGPPPAQASIENLAKGYRELTGLPVTIGEAAWIGASAVIGPGVTIGERAVVAPGAVVLDDVPAYAEVMGNPASVINGRMPPKTTGYEEKEEHDQPHSPVVYYQM
ncbi:trimeric LpxA-like protein [Hypoxylon sp. FL1857]|nr:trimeric LpxA-like protein [Hypoxylon sp. FL1857]